MKPPLALWTNKIFKGIGDEKGHYWGVARA